jgi:DNA polymerase-1
MLYFDVETNGLLHQLDRIHCIVTKDSVTKEVLRYDEESLPISDAVKIIQAAKVTCGHNIIGFDIPAIRMVYPWFNPVGEVRDTLVMARVHYADIKGSDFGRWKEGKLPGRLIGKHTLESYGYRLGANKDDFFQTTDWQTWTEEMTDYCVQDVLLVEKVYGRMEGKIDPRCMYIEHKIAGILNLQEKNGILFDVRQAGKLHAHLLQEREPLLAELKELVKPWYKPKAYQKDKPLGKVFMPKRDNKKYGYTEGMPMCHIVYTEFNPASTQEVANRLTKLYGWKPTEFTKTGLPQVNEEVLKLLKYPIIKPLLSYLTINKRLGQLVEGKHGWLKHVKQDSHRIHGGVIGNGAVTGRMAHVSPNLGQVPAAYSPYGPECRELFVVPPGKKLVGIDASGIELRCLAHYMSRWDKGAYAEVILHADIHIANMEALGITDRDIAKTFIYAFLYGAGKKKLAQILLMSMPKAAKAYGSFMETLPALNKLVKAVKAKFAVDGVLAGLDGRVLKIRSEHSALNTLLQAAGAVAMKEAQCIFYDDLVSTFGTHGDRWAFALTIHDEWQMECDEDISDTVGKMGVAAIKQAGINLGFRMPLDGEFKIGDNWRETH